MTDLGVIWKRFLALSALWLSFFTALIWLMGAPIDLALIAALATYGIPFGGAFCCLAVSMERIP